ncbi:HNH endonuclease [Tissierella praeacuta]|uniref:HNH endonuclease n=1 Tax=Tissierella praeacuta TaxID=43131 RepID=UPI00333E3130
MALKKLCKCGKVIDYNQKYCSQCSVKYKQERKEYHKHYDKYIRDQDAADFYNSAEWEKAREYVIAKYEGLDLYAFFIEKEIIYADTVHHIEELRENWNRRLDISNLIPLSRSNHNKIHKMYEKDREGVQELLFNLLERWKEEYGYKT